MKEFVEVKVDYFFTEPTNKLVPEASIHIGDIMITLKNNEVEIEVYHYNEFLFKEYIKLDKLKEVIEKFEQIKKDRGL